MCAPTGRASAAPAPLQCRQSPLERTPIEEYRAALYDFLLAHVLVGKPVTTFPGHALAAQRVFPHQFADIREGLNHPDLARELIELHDRLRVALLECARHVGAF